MTRAPGLPWRIRKRILELAVLHGKDNVTLIQRSLQMELRELRLGEGFAVEYVPDVKTIHQIVNEYLDGLPPQAVIKYLDESEWTLRKDYEALKLLAEAKKAEIQEKPYRQPSHKDKMREDHNQSLTLIAGMLLDNAVKLQEAPNWPTDGLVARDREFTIVGSIYVGPAVSWGFDPLAVRDFKYWYVDPTAATCLLAHLNQEFPELRVDDWWAVKKANITPDLVDALRGLAARQSFAPAAGCTECRSIQEAAQA